MEEQYQKTLALAEDIKQYVGKTSKQPSGSVKVQNVDGNHYLLFAMCCAQGEKVGGSFKQWKIEIHEEKQTLEKKVEDFH